MTASGSRSSRHAVVVEDAQAGPRLAAAEPARDHLAAHERRLGEAGRPRAAGESGSPSSRPILVENRDYVESPMVPPDCSAALRAASFDRRACEHSRSSTRRPGTRSSLRAAAEPVPALHLGARVARRAELRVRARTSSSPSATASSSASRRSSCSSRARAHRELRRRARVGARGHPARARRGGLARHGCCSTRVVASARPDALDVFGLPAESNSRAPPASA